MEALTGSLMLKIVMTGAGALWAFVQGTRLYRDIKKSEFATLEEEAERAVHETAVELGEQYKRAHADGKLTKEEIAELRGTARRKFTGYLESKGEDVAKKLGYRGVDLLVEKAFARLKQAGVIMALLLCVGMMAGCATTGADGTQRPAITPQQQAQVNRFIGALVSGGIQYYEAREAVEAERHIYEDAKKTAVQAGGVAAVTAWSAEQGGKTKAEALQAGRRSAEAWCITKGTTLAEVMGVVAKGAPAKVDAGDIFEGILAEQLRYIAAQQADAAQ